MRQTDPDQGYNKRKKEGTVWGIFRPEEPQTGGGLVEIGMRSKKEIMQSPSN